MIYRSISALERLSTGESRHASTAYLKDRRRHERKAYWAGIRRNGKLALRRWRKPLGRYLVLALAVAALGVPALFWLRGPVPSHQKVAIKPILPVTPVASVPAVTSQTVLPAMTIPAIALPAATATAPASPGASSPASAPVPAQSAEPVFVDPKAVAAPAVEPVIALKLSTSLFALSLDVNQRILNGPLRSTHGAGSQPNEDFSDGTPRHVPLHSPLLI